MPITRFCERNQRTSSKPSAITDASHERNPTRPCDPSPSSTDQHVISHRQIDTRSLRSKRICEQQRCCTVRSATGTAVRTPARSVQWRYARPPVPRPGSIHTPRAHQPALASLAPLGRAFPSAHRRVPAAARPLGGGYGPIRIRRPCTPTALEIRARQPGLLLRNGAAT